LKKETDYIHCPIVRTQAQFRKERGGGGPFEEGRPYPLSSYFLLSARGGSSEGERGSDADDEFPDSDFKPKKNQKRNKKKKKRRK